MPSVSKSSTSRQPQVLTHAPEELIRTRLQRMGEGIGKVVYASEHWVVKRERTPFEIVALIVVWRLLRRFERLLPKSLRGRLIDKPSRQLRLLRVVVQATLAVIPKAVWFPAHTRAIWREYHTRSLRGERLARSYLDGSSLIPQPVIFPPTRVRVRGWPGSLTVSEATERVESTFDQKLADLARANRFDQVEEWLDRLLVARQAGWSRGLFSLDAHFKNYGVVGDRIVLLDSGGLTNRWDEVDRKLQSIEQVAEPHRELGLGALLAEHPEIALRFNARWKAVVNRVAVRERWPG